MFLINMSLSPNYSTMNKRFDFAVPLEDIFTNGGIHPRLRFIFQQAFDLCLESHLSIRETLQKECCLSTCLELKQRIIYARQPVINSQYSSPGAFFWIIRHFLGLLPIPLFPAVTCNQKFPWKELSQQIKHVSQYNLTEREYKLLYTIASALNNLPQEHLSLLNILVMFIRNISKKKCCKTSLKDLAKYYCDAVFVRPFQPGHKIKDENMFPLFMYIITRWYRILKYLRTDNTNAFHYVKSDVFPKHDTDLYIETNWFPDTHDTHNVPYTIVKYLKDVECQTDISEENNFDSIPNYVDKSVQLIDSFIKDEDVSLKTFTNHLNERKISSFRSSLININETEENIQCKHCNTLDFFGNIMNDRNKNWNDVVQEVANTVKRIEAHNYEICDKYSRSGDFVGCSALQKSDSSVESGTTETVYNTLKDSTINSYKTEDSERTVSYKSVNGTSKVERKNRKNDKNVSLYKSFYESDDELYNINKKSINYDKGDERNTSNFSLNRFKIKFNFLRTLSPKFKRPDDFRFFFSRSIKYKKF
ncbi:uncharacterized protein LOC130903452 [Diorhabda carinulata]|uniref:uncharacterized protein LOC130903452 n=1 Tax=Diorhabda carinulata TaxID=1163345 RepID=UPI0025A2F458|nr:uncharacterized protein LOC130903452 [Diorhabda carinulata]